MKNFDDAVWSDGEYHDEDSFLGYSPRLSSEHAAALGNLAHIAEQYPFQTPAHAVTPLLLNPRESDFIHGKTESAYGLYGVHPQLLEVPTPLPLRATFLHERTHTQVGSDVRRAFLENHAAVDAFFRSVIVPDWLAGRVALRDDSGYISSKGWRSLYDGWLGPMDITLPKAIEAVDRYFQLFRKGLVKIITIGRGDEISTPSYELAVRKLNLAERPEISLEEFYQTDSKGCVRQVLAGFALIQYLDNTWRNVYSRRSGRGVWDIEEGFATFIGCSLAEISIDDLQRYCRQDEGKLITAHKIQSTGVSATDALTRVTGYESLVHFIEELGL
jgi:hypothetical protein